MGGGGGAGRGSKIWTKFLFCEVDARFSHKSGSKPGKIISEKWSPWNSVDRLTDCARNDLKSVEGS